ncbi:MAG: hypothetical protein LBS36_04745 [Oscillospiraceae bacterium]|jgi:hypothetical protein|nr:hypothetical protein [Oscillospiraceae bacterium]
MIKKTALLLAISMLFAMLLVGCANETGSLTVGGFPKIKVYSGNTDIEWVVGMNRLGNAQTDREDNLIGIIKDNAPGDLVYLKNGESITIEFDGKLPDTVKLTEHIIKADGSAKYTTEHKGTAIDIAFKKGKGSFVIEKNYATALSSNSADYAPGATIKGYRLLCNFGTDECEYAFVIRGDAAFTMTAETFAPRELLNYFYNDHMPWDSVIDLDIPEFEGIKFKWTFEKITANGEDILFGMPVWSVYLADLNGDNLPEICASTSFGSGIVDNRIIVYDYFNKKSYELSDRMVYDYSLSLENGKLVVKQTAYNEPPGTGKDRGTGSLAIINDELATVGIDRIKPE